MKTNLLATACAVFSLTLGPAAFAQQTVGPVTGDPTLANSQSGSASNASNQNTSTVGPIDASHGDTITGPSSAESRSDSNSGAVSGSVSHSEGGAGGNATAASNATGGTSSATTGASTSSSVANPNANNQGNAQNITFNSETPKHQKLETNPTVYAPALSTTLTETCMGSTSGGISVLGFGGTLGTTWEDKQCVRRLNAREMAGTLGDREAARALMCQDADVAKAYAAVGQPCNAPYQPRVAVNAGGPTAYTLPPVPPETAAAAIRSEPRKMEPIPNPPEEKGERGASADDPNAKVSS